jgi:hypothetical protein
MAGDEIDGQYVFVLDVTSHKQKGKLTFKAAFLGALVPWWFPPLWSCFDHITFARFTR